MSKFLDDARKMMTGELPGPPIADLVGMKLKEIEPGRALFELNAEERHHNPLGTVHGGIYCDLADVAMGMAFASTLLEDESFTTVELKINFLRPVRRGTMMAEARVIKTGTTVGYVECDIKDLNGQLLARVASTCLKLRKDRPK